ncbi:hypothetical protein QE454_003336 [Microbacterium sp. SORGH_AS454]|nr:hypothetical protein [Microbacterium sp. SORGH_AS_0454]
MRPVEAERDRQTHVGRRRLRDGRAVDELDHRVHDRLRVHGHRDPVVRHVEEQVRLDHLKALVDESGGVRRDHTAHVPRGVSEGLRGGDVLQLVARASAEGASGCREHEPAHFTVVTGAQRLSDRGVLGVHRDDLPLGGERGDELAADDQRLFVGEGEGAPRLEGGDGGTESDRPGDAVEHHVGLDVADELLGLDGAEGGVLDAEGQGLRLDAGTVGAGGEADDLEAIGVVGDDVERLRADRTGGTEDEDAAHALSLVSPPCWRAARPGCRRRRTGSSWPGCRPAPCRRSPRRAG